MLICRVILALSYILALEKLGNFSTSFILLFLKKVSDYINGYKTVY